MGEEDPSTPPNEEGKTFTQAEVDAIVKRRAERVAAEKYSDYNDLRAKAKRLEEIEAANATDLEKATAAARKEGESSATQAANKRLVNAEARALAAEARFRNPNLATKALDLSGVTVDDDGVIDASAIKALLADLAKDEPYLVDDGKTGKPQPDPSQGLGGGAPSGADLGRAEAARRFGPKAGQH